MIDLGDGPRSIRETLDGYVVPFVPHLVVRGTYLPGTVRCTAGDRHRLHSYEDPEDYRFVLNTLSFKCYADVRANAYIVGEGSSTVTVQVNWDIYRDGDYASSAEIERYRQGYEQLLMRGRLDSSTTMR